MTAEPSEPPGLVPPEGAVESPVEDSSDTSLNTPALGVQAEHAVGRLEHFDRQWSKPMCVCGLLSLLFLAGILHLHDRIEYWRVFLICVAGSLVVYPVFWVEWVLAWRAGSTRVGPGVLNLLIPPLRIGTRDHATGKQVWVPGLGWLRAGDDSLRRVERALSWPMMAISLAVLPLMLFEYLYASRIEQDPRLAGLIATATGLIWFCFAVEFILGFSLTSNRLRYCRTHWIDLVIILLPLLAFMRALRLGRLLRVNQVLRTAQMWRMRSLASRMWRALLLVRLVRRVMHGSDRARMATLVRQISEKEQELLELRNELQGLQAASDRAAPPVVSRTT